MTDLTVPEPPAVTRNFHLPPQSQRRDGAMRRVGFELEFSGLSVVQAADTLATALGVSATRSSSAEYAVEHADLGSFTVEVDWRFLKEQARMQASRSAGGRESDWTEILGDLASLLVPIEVVCPPIPMDRLDALPPLIDALREAGAVGTGDTAIAAYGVHVNVEIPTVDAPTVHRYLRAYALLQWWLFEEHAIDPARRLSPYVTPYPEAYLQEIHDLVTPTMDNLLAHYLEHNATRNRALDMLPMFALEAEDSVQARVDDPRIKARPAFHYRLPDCHIERRDWSLSQPWTRWCVVEALASDAEALDDLARRFRAARRPVIGVARNAWVQEVDTWLSDRALA